MTKKEAIKILGNRANWELLKMKEALQFMEVFNNPEENERLEACKILLSNKG